MNKKIIKAQSGDAAFSGSGKLSDFKVDGSWIMNQLEKGYDKVERGVTIDKSTGNIIFSNAHKRKNDSGNVFFSNVHSAEGDLKNNNIVSDTEKRIASKIITASEDYKIIKYYKILNKNQNYISIAFKLYLFGKLDGCSINDLNLVKEFLLNRFYSDCKKIEEFYEINLQYITDVCIDFNKNCVRFQSLVDVCSDQDTINEILTSLYLDYKLVNSQEVF